MRTAYKTPEVTLTARPTGELEVDLLVVPVFEDDDDLADEPGLDAAAGGEIARARHRGEFKAKLFDVFNASLSSGMKTPRAILVGAGRRADLTADHLRRIAVIGGLAARHRHLAKIALVHRAGTRVTPDEAAQVLAEGVCLANYDGASYKTEDR